MRLHRLGIADVEGFEHGVAHSLAGLLRRPRIGRKGVPAGVPFVDHGRAVALREPVEVGHVEARFRHAGEHRLRGRGGGGEEGHPPGQGAALRIGGVDQELHHHRRAAQVGDPMLGHQPVHGLRPHLPQADMGAGHDGQGPGEAPAVAVEHRQGPEIDRVPAEPARDHVGEGQEGRPPVVVDDALGVAGRPGRVVEADRVPLVRGKCPLLLGIPPGEERLVAEFAQGLAGTIILRRRCPPWRFPGPSGRRRDAGRGRRAPHRCGAGRRE